MRSFPHPPSNVKAIQNRLSDCNLNWVSLLHAHASRRWPQLSPPLLTKFPETGSINPRERQRKPFLDRGQPCPRQARAGRKPPGTDWEPGPALAGEGAGGRGGTNTRPRLRAASGARPRPASRAGTPPSKKGAEPLAPTRVRSRSLGPTAAGRPSPV